MSRLSNLRIKTVVNPQFYGRFAETEGIVGSTLLCLLKDAKELALKLECGVQFDFNGHLVSMYPYSDPEEQERFLLNIWSILDASNTDKTLP